MPLRRVSPSAPDVRDPVSSHAVPGWIDALTFTNGGELVLATASGVYSLDGTRGDLATLWEKGRTWGLRALDDSLQFVSRELVIRCNLQTRSSATVPIHQRFPWPAHPFSAAAFSPSGTRLALAGGYTDKDEGVFNWLALIDADTGQWDRCLYHELNRHSGHRLEFDPSGEHLFECTTRDVVQWPVRGGDPRLLGLEHTCISAVAFHPDGKRIATCDLSGGQLKVTDLDTGRCLSACEHRHRGTFAMAWTADDRLLLSADRDVWLYDRRNGPVHRVLIGGGSEVTAIAERPGTGTFLIGSRGTRLVECTLASGEPPGRTGHDGPVRALAIVSQRIVSAGDDERIVAWDLPSGAALTSVRVHSPIRTIHASGDDVFFGHRDGAVSCRNAHTLELRWCSPPRIRQELWPGQLRVEALFTDSRGRVISVVDGAVHLRNAASGDVLESVPGLSPVLWAVMGEARDELLLKCGRGATFVPLADGDPRDDLRKVAKILDSDDHLSAPTLLEGPGRRATLLAVSHELRWFDLDRGQRSRSVDLRMERTTLLPCRIAVSSQGRFVGLTGGDTWRAWLIDGATADVRGEVDLPAGATACAADDEGHLVIGDVRGDVVVWALDSPSPPS